MTQNDGVAVGRASCHLLHGRHAATPGFVVYQHGYAQLFGQLLRHLACHDV